MRNAYPIDVKKLRQVMKYRGETAISITATTDISYNTINCLLRGKTKYPKLQTLGSLAIALQVSWHMLVKEE